MFGVGQKELIIFLVIVLIIFGPKNLPRLARSLGRSVRELKDGLSGVGEDIKESMHPKSESEAQPTPTAAAPGVSDTSDAEPTPEHTES